MCLCCLSDSVFGGAHKISVLSFLLIRAAVKHGRHCVDRLESVISKMQLFLGKVTGLTYLFLPTSHQSIITGSNFLYIHIIVPVLLTKRYITLRLLNFDVCCDRLLNCLIGSLTDICLLLIHHRFFRILSNLWKNMKNCD